MTKFDGIEGPIMNDRNKLPTVELLRENIVHVIDGLQSIQKRPAMYFGVVTADAAHNYLSGFQLAFLTLGIEVRDYNLRVKAYERCGWHYTADYVSTEMREYGLSEDEIVYQLIKIEITLWQLMLVSVPE